MVIQEETDMPVEFTVVRKPFVEQKKYVIVNNHVRELISENQESNTHVDQSSKSLEKASLDLQHATSTRYTKSKNISLPNKSTINPSPHNDTEISASDLEELRTVYTKCKNVIKKIETKYGHLLNLTKTGSTKRKLLEENDSSDQDICHCKLNKKIMYDDDGNEITIDTTLENHICLKKPKLYTVSKNLNNHILQVDYNDMEIHLPESLPELNKCLQDPHCEATYRNKVIEKIKSIRQEYLDELRFSKRAIIEKLKTNPDELLDFKGTNLSTLSGYS